MHRFDSLPNRPAQVAILRAEVERLLIENWQLKGALGYEVPGDIPEGSFRCGSCEARAVKQYTEGQMTGFADQTKPFRAND